MAKNYKKLYEELEDKFISYLCHMSMDRMSYSTYDLETMKSVSDAAQEEFFSDTYKSDISDIINEDMDAEDKIEEIKKYLDIDGKE